MLTELEGRFAAVALETQGQTRVLERNAKALGGRRVRSLGATGQQIPRLRKEPRIPERAARDHDPRAAGVIEHGQHILVSADVTIHDLPNFMSMTDMRDLCLFRLDIAPHLPL